MNVRKLKIFYVLFLKDWTVYQVLYPLHWHFFIPRLFVLALWHLPQSKTCAFTDCLFLLFLCNIFMYCFMAVLFFVAQIKHTQTGGDKLTGNWLFPVCRGFSCAAKSTSSSHVCEHSCIFSHECTSFIINDEPQYCFCCFWVHSVRTTASPLLLLQLQSLCLLL